MSALAQYRIERAEAALKLNTDVLADLDAVVDDPDRGPFWAVGQLQTALYEANQVIDELLGLCRDNGPLP